MYIYIYIRISIYIHIYIDTYIYILYPRYIPNYIFSYHIISYTLYKLHQIIWSIFPSILYPIPIQLIFCFLPELSSYCIRYIYNIYIYPLNPWCSPLDSHSHCDESNTSQRINPQYFFMLPSGNFLLPILNG